MDTYADDLAALAEALDLKNAVHVGHSTGGGEVARYIGRHDRRVAKAVADRRCGAADAPGRGQSRRPADVGLRRDPARRSGGPLAVLQGPRDAVLRANRPGSKVSRGAAGDLLAPGDAGGIKGG